MAEREDKQMSNLELQEQLKPFRDCYFDGLTTVQIAELAKKSIRITIENIKLRYALEQIQEIIKKVDNARK